MANPGDIYRAAVKFDMPDEQAAFNIYDLYQFTGSCTDAELLTAVSTWVTAAYANLVAQVRSTVDIQECRVNKMLWSGTQWYVEKLVGTVFPTFSPTAVTDMLPHAVAGLVEFPTSSPRRVGKKYLPGITETEQNESTLTAGCISAMSDYALDILSNITAGTATIKYVVLSNLGSPLSPTTSFIPALISSQRRRKPGVGI